MKGLLCENVIMNKQLEVFVKCFYVWTKIGLRTLNLAFFFGVGLDWIFILKYWTRLGVEKIQVRSIGLIALIGL